MKKKFFFDFSLFFGQNTWEQVWISAQQPFFPLFVGFDWIK